MKDEKLLEYICEDCGEVFETTVSERKSKTRVRCHFCGSVWIKYNKCEKNKAMFK